MQLTLWTYEGPPHVGAMRIATAMRGVHLVLHAPQGDTYANLLFTMIERRPKHPPVTFTTFQARDLGADTAGLLQNAVREAFERFRPEVLLVGASCTAELLQDDPAGLSRALALPVSVVPLELPAYQHKENWGAAETFYQLVRTACASQPTRKREGEAAAAAGPVRSVAPARCNILGPTALGFRHRDDVLEVRRLLERLGVIVEVIAPLGASVADLRRLPQADFNVLLYPEIGRPVAEWLQQRYAQPYTRTVPIGLSATRQFVREVAELAHMDAGEPAADESRMAWYSRSVDSTYLTGKRVYIFGDATHALAAARIAAQELGLSVVGLGTYSREFAREVRAAAADLGIEALISDDYLQVESQVAQLRPDLVLGTQMERHIAKRLAIPCAVISAPVHVQDYPARYAPQCGFEGANVIFDTWVQPLMMGLEEHLLTMFREDFEFNPQAAASHLGSVTAPAPAPNEPMAPVAWAVDAELELNKVPFFVRAKARRNTERYAQERHIDPITIETLYEAKHHFAR